MLSGIDHVAITCTDVDAALAFYERVLGAELQFAEHWRSGALPVAIVAVGATNLSLHRAASPAEPHAARPTPGAADVCFRWEGTIEQAVAHLGGHGVEVVEGPVGRRASDGRPALSVYFRDVDGNLLEFLAVDDRGGR